MNSLPLHPVLVHVPLALAGVVPLVAAGLLLAWWRGWLPGRAWLVVVGLQAVLVAGGFAALQTGEGDEERVEPVVGEATLEAHEEAAEVFVWSAAGVLVLALAGALAPRDGVRRAAALVATLAMIGVVGLAVRVGHAGGELVYRHGAAAAWAAPGGAPPPATGRALPRGDRDDED